MKRLAFETSTDPDHWFDLALSLDALDIAPFLLTSAVKEVGRLPKGKGLDTIAFAASWQTGDARGAVDLLVDAERACEAALLARTYAPYGELERKGRALIGDPLRGEERELFEEGWEDILHLFREMNEVHIDTRVDLKTGFVGFLSVVLKLSSGVCFCAFSRFSNVKLPFITSIFLQGSMDRWI